ncbi:MAG TPA: serine hydrolase domain-containing protein [Solirubrobacterales bacterium]|nr:serine hydrolase domain-containing protein [Solirubrobacterales bacterium]
MPSLPPGLTALDRLPRVPRLPVGPDPLRRVRVPRDLDAITTVGTEADPEAGDVERRGVEAIWRAATDWFRSGVHPALQVCVRRNGEVVLDRAIGHARGNGPADGADAEKVAATTETPFCVYSASKAITAFVVHKLCERGVLHLEDPIAEHIPGYERHNKGNITIGHVLAHKAGVPNLPREALDLEYVGDREFLCEVLCEAKPATLPGTQLAYHAVSGGFILGEVVHRVTGKNIRAVLAEEILDPLGFRWTNYGVDPADVDAVAVNYVTGPPTAPPISTMLARALGSGLDDLVATTNDPRFLTGVVPAANTITTANELSRFFELLRRGGELDGVRILEPDTIRRALIERSHLEVDLSLGFPTRFSYGLMLGARLLSLYGLDTQHAFGHLGYTNMLGWADPERAIAVAVLNNGKPILYPEVHRFLGTMQRITSEMPKVPEEERYL